jgi:hypothetical protein
LITRAESIEHNVIKGADLKGHPFLFQKVIDKSGRDRLQVIKDILIMKEVKILAIG